MIREGRVSTLDRGDSFAVFKHLVWNTQEPVLADSLTVGAQGVLKALQLLGRAWPGSWHPEPPRGSPAIIHGKSAQGARDTIAISSLPQVTWPESQVGFSCLRLHAEK